MAKTYILTATSINGGRKSSYESDWRNFSANENKDAGRRNDDYKATNILFDAATLASLRSKTVTSIKLALTLTSGTIYTSASYARQLIGYKLNSTATTSGDGAAWTRSDANSTAASGTVYAGQILVATETTITSPTTILFDITGSSVPVYGYVIGPSRSSLSSFSYITISGASLHVTTNEYDITYDANGGTGAPAAQTKTHGTALTLSSTTPTHASDVTNYTITYNANGGSVSPASTTVRWEKQVEFSRWNTKADGTGTSYSPGGSYTANASVTMYAQWTSDASAPMVTLPTPTRTGYTFNGWYTAASGGTRVGGGGDPFAASTTTLYAQWTIKKYTVSYSGNGVIGSAFTDIPASQEKTHGTDLTLSNNLPTRANESAGSRRVNFNANSGSVSPSYLDSEVTESFTFDKWNTAAGGTGTNYPRGGTYSANANATLYAKWTISSPTATAITLPTPTRANYLFNGWYTAASGGTRVGGGGSSYVPTTSATTLHAQWSAAKSTVSATSGELGTAQTITITRSNSSFTHTLTYSYGGATGTIATKTSTYPTVSWTPPTSLAEQFPSATSGTCTITCETFNGNTSLGTTTTTCSLAIPDSIAPSIDSFTATPQSSNTAISGWGVLVKGYSTAQLNVTYTLNGYASIASIAFSGPGISSTGTATTATTSMLTTPGSKTWTVIVKDSRGRTATTTVTANVEDYAKPVISSIEVCRCDSNGTQNNGTGTYIKFKPHFSVSSVDGNNGLATSNGAMLEWRVSGGSFGTAFSVSDDTWTAVQGAGAIDLTKSYEGQLTVTDKVGESTPFTVTLPSASGLWYGRGNDRLGLGGVPPSAGVHCDWDATFNGVLDVTKRRVPATSLSSNSWHRLLKVASIWRGDAPFSIDIHIGRDNSNNEQHDITLLVDYDSYSFVDETSKSNTLLIQGVRYANDGTDGWVDILYGTTAQNNVYADFTVHCQPGHQGSFTPESLQAVAASPSGETVLATYTFIKNANSSKAAGFYKTEYVGNIASGGTASFSYNPASKVTVFRASSSATPVSVLLDQWDGITYLSRNDSLATVSVSGKSVTITNTSSSYVDYIAEIFN